MMCGRFTLIAELDELLRRFNPTGMPDFVVAPRFNIAPTQLTLVLMQRDGTRQFTQARWGLIPNWAKDPSVGSRMINARAETVDTKPSFAKLLRHKRCLVLADSFYEWSAKTKPKTPFRILRRDGLPFAFAGLWNVWARGSGNPLLSCTIITTEANTLVADIHHRMPVILDQADEDVWLATDLSDPIALKRFLKPYPSQDLTKYPVSTTVNSPANDLPACIERVVEGPPS